MIKLTREQADWLIEKIRDDQQSRVLVVEKCNDAARVFVQMMATLEETINQCTEKAFPGLLLYNEDGHCLAEIEQSNKELSIYCPVSLSYDEFKQFAQGVNAVVEWIEGQE